MANCNYKVHMKDIQNKYKFKIFCTGSGADLTNYYTKNETDTLLNAKVGFTDYATNSTGGVIKTNSQYNTNVDGGSLYTPTKTYEQYQSMTNGAFVGKGTLENVITGKNLETANNKVTSLSSSSTDTQYPSAKAVYDSQVEQNIQISDLKEENDYLQSIINQMPKVTGEGTNITLDNTLEAKLDIQLKGNTSQETTAGKNLLNISTIEQTTKNGITCTYNNLTQEITFNGTCTTDNTRFAIQNIIISFKANTTKYCAYYVTGTINGNSLFRIFGANYDTYDFLSLNQLNSNNAMISKTTSNTISKTIFDFKFDNGDVLNNFKIKLMVTDNDDISYEPYTNGTSPNPDYPQEIEVVTGENVVRVERKNLFDKDNANQIKNWFVTQNKIFNNNSTQLFYIKCKPNTQYTISKVASTRLQFWCTTEKPDVGVSTSASLNQDYDFTGTVKTITTTSDANYLLCYYYLSTTDTLTEEEIRNSIQIEEGDTATTYESYKGQTYPINLGSIELCKIGNYQDRIYKSNGNWYLHKEIGKVVLDGSENWFAVTNGIQGGYDYFYSSYIDNTAMKYLTYNIYCDKMNVYNGQMAYNTLVTVDTINISNNDSTNLLRIRFLETRIASYTVANFKSWLSNNNVTLYYVLATPTDTQITDTTLISQLNALENAMSYAGQTNISQVNNDASFIINASALYDLNNLVTRVAVLETE